MSTTGIPIEYMFGCIAALIGVVYAAINYEIRTLRKTTGDISKGAHRRDLVLVRICEKLGIEFRDDE